MKRSRLTYEGAFHHCMNRGINGESIFAGQQNKSQFLDYLEESVRRYRIKLYAYCIMENHYHLILENRSGKLSDFFRHLNGQYGMYYRKISGEKGYVFQNRFKSTIIQDDTYLKTAVGYCILNPVRARIVECFDHYVWSSGSYYFSEKENSILDIGFVNELFVSKEELFNFLANMSGQELNILETRYGEVLGEDGYVNDALSRFDRRKKDYGFGRKRLDERLFEEVEKIIWEFEKKIGYPIYNIDTRTREGRNLRGELLVLLRDVGGLRFPEINRIPFFENYQVFSMSKLYHDTLRRLKKS